MKIRLTRRTLLKAAGAHLAYTILISPVPGHQFFGNMEKNTNFDVIIIGGSSAGLSAGMTLGRALRKVLIIDSGLPCNLQTPHSHNFFTQDGQTPTAMLSIARKQLSAYKTVESLTGLAIKGKKTDHGFEITTESGESFVAKKLVFATGIKDTMPLIEGFKECWGISVIHCPYCHGYEYRNEKTGIFANGELGFDTSKLISNWTKDLTLYTNGKSGLTQQQTITLQQHGIKIEEKVLDQIIHKKGQIEKIRFKDGSETGITALYARLGFTQHCDIPEDLGCEMTEQGHIKADMLMKSSVAGVYACGDNITPMRSIANAAYNGSVAGAALNMELINESFS